MATYMVNINKSLDSDVIWRTKQTLKTNISPITHLEKHKNTYRLIFNTIFFMVFDF